ncbi:hypothetical protein [Polyangium sp. 6x1]|nr:hypothetical protein [Polyangium sp. 6x1]
MPSEKGLSAGIMVDFDPVPAGPLHFFTDDPAASSRSARKLG